MLAAKMMYAARMSAATNVILNLLRNVVWPLQQLSFNTDGMGDALFHIVQNGTYVVDGCAVTVASSNTKDLILWSSFREGKRDVRKFCAVRLTVTQKFERRLEHLLGDGRLKRLLTGQSVASQGPANASLKRFPDKRT